MAKISNPDIYKIDKTYSDNDTWVGTDAQDGKKTKTYTLGGVSEYIIDKYNLTGVNGVFQNTLLKGNYYKIANYDYFVFADKWILDNVIYQEHIEATITLSPADDTYDRFDLIVINLDKTISVIEGTPDANPSKPTTDPALYLEVGLILVQANTTEDESVIETTIYNENLQVAGGEFDTVAVQNAVLDSTISPDDGGVHMVLPAGGSVVLLNNSDYVNIADIDKVILRVRKVTSDYSQLTFTFKDTNGSLSQQQGKQLALGDAVNAAYWNFDTNNISTYQTIVIDAAFFATGNYQITKFNQIRIVKGGNIDATTYAASCVYYIDKIITQKGTSLLNDTINIPTRTSQLINDGEGDEYGAFVKEGHLAEVAFTGNYRDLGGTPVFKVVENTYADMADAYANQLYQTETFIQYVEDASDYANDPVIVGGKYFEYLGTVYEDERDYRMLSDEEAAPITSTISKTSEIENDGETGISPYAEVRHLPTKVSDLTNDSLFINETALPQNTVIRGIQGTITTKYLLIQKFRHASSGIAWSNADADRYIKNFEIVGDEIRCYITKDYYFADGPFRPSQPYAACTHYYDYDGRVSQFNFQDFRGSSVIQVVHWPKATGNTQFIFEGCTSLTTAYLPSIHTANFYGCSSLTSLTITGATTLSQLTNCSSLTGTLNIPNVKTTSGEDILKGTGITTVNAPELTTISGNNFRDASSLTTFNAPKVLTISGGSFRNANNVTTLSFPLLTTISPGATRLFEMDAVNLIYMPSCKVFGNESTIDEMFYDGAMTGCVLVVNDHLRTSNAGGLNANIQDAINAGMIVKFIPDYPQNYVNNLVNVSAAYTLKDWDYTVNITGNSFAVTLPTAIGRQGKVYTIKNSGTGTITINTTASQTIDGSTSGSLSLPQYGKLMVQSNNTNWIILEN